MMTMELVMGDEVAMMENPFFRLAIQYDLSSFKIIFFVAVLSRTWTKWRGHLFCYTKVSSTPEDDTWKPKKYKCQRIFDKKIIKN